MDYQYNYTVSQTLNNKVDSARLQQEVQDSAITIALDYINVVGNNINLFFKAELSDDEELILEGVIAAHTGEALIAPPAIVKAEILTEHLKFVESNDTTQSLFSAESLIIDVSAGEVTKTIDFVWPFDIALMSATLGVSEDMIGDDFYVDVAPNTLVGALIAPVNVGDTSIYVSDTVLQNVNVGYYVGLYASGEQKGTEIEQVIYKDTENSCLTLRNPADVSANAGEYVAMCSKLIPRLYLHSQDKIEIGKDVPTGFRLPKGKAIQVCYHNNNLVAKKVSFFIEYLY